MERKGSSSPETGSTSHGSSGAEFDVFLSFRGPDTHANFTDSLHHALLDEGIRVFIDKKRIDVGEEIGPEIFQAISDLKICIPIFSRGYASGIWCLHEPGHMMERRKTNDLKPWAEVLKEVARVEGWDTKNQGHEELAQLIARNVLVKLKGSYVHISDDLVGIDKSVHEVVDLLNVKSEDIRFIEICRIGGIGKTTLAKVVYHKLSTNIDSCGFISNIREASKGSCLSNLKRHLVFDILGNIGVELSSIDHGINMMKDRFNGKKVLIFLDDVDHRSQFMALAAKAEWFGLGSRIVVTTRDRSVLSGFQDQFEHCLIYEAKELNNLEALQLFSKHAFRSNSPPNALFSLSEEVTVRM
ncbi:disease resistance protein RUN1-like [Eucalyptus grandis]|uniref:disease resistance protein RUN1-like n=1 Tax=Eucalyptus grandis TaxID=71139 RepID=UPI00192E9A27|nr:disease resistance protein RUN1-like [Eucalyptus grandis]